MSHSESYSHNEIVPNFVKKLVNILTEKQNAFAVKWMKDGNGFKILHQQKFTSQVLPKYYRHANMPSFIRQLNMYGFHKIKDGEQTFYKHPLFKKDCPEMYSSISRKPEKKNCPLENEKNSQKQNIAEQRKDQKTSKKKKVSFVPQCEQKSENQESHTLKKTRKEIMSNVSLKYAINNPRQNTLLELYNLQSQPWLAKNYDDGLSICQHLQCEDEGQQFFESSRRLIFCTPQEILSNLNNE